MGAARLNLPTILVYGGTIRPGSCSSHPQLDVVSAFQSYGEYIAGKITDEERLDIVRNSCPGAGACGGMYTANTSTYFPHLSPYPTKSSANHTFSVLGH